MAGGAPVGVVCLERCCCPRSSRSSRKTKDFWYKIAILIFTFLCYTSYHLSRKPISVVKNVLSMNCSEQSHKAKVHNETHCGWPPFNSEDSQELLGTLDSAFLFSYAFAMFFSGLVAERVNLRYFLALGMLLSGIFTYLFGIAYSYGIHHIWYFIFVQAVCGVVQSSGWPSVVTCIGNWFGKGRRGLIFGIWNSHTSVGNILGSLIAGIYVDVNWGLSFIVPGAIIGVMGFVVFLFLAPYPEDVGCSSPDHHDTKLPDEERPILVDDNVIDHLHQNGGEERVRAVTFSRALKIPGVIEFSLCLFFAKLVSYTFLYWLPSYINASASVSATVAANLSTLFDVGGIIGGIIAGVISDHTGASATTCTLMLLVAIPMLFIYQAIGTVNLATNIALLMVCGLMVNGPYALITTAVSAELGTHKSLRGNSKALATVASIIDGTGSLGAAIGPLLAGLISPYGWSNVFYMLMIADVCALLLLIRLSRKEVLHLLRKLKDKRHHQYA